MKVLIEGQVSFHVALLDGTEKPKDDETEVQVEVIGPPDEDLEGWQVLISHPKVSITLSRSELERALRVFERRGR